ncbi:ABC transporter permease subunit [Sinorhizobium medicae]|uniref:Putative transporter subunit: permease component of ABC superfamily n=1 Tax=Sinorhizobium medicae TaxID=110321 RepID=A0A508X3X2_9HYPH|nr:ABC transporter permease [Sinorhizobium medicae]MBO1941776.1 ABC transporter permease [Sinorhizobium medicae]MDX0520714.1 ABC transporter permease subunit [Sinorhizobium medicae]MDX0547578.1 ABC transporter permease subunit [Sinorhizobium medicae]MDX0583318.1 ABC transporter permease subunit [Sinorhizobium medicae]MDX0627944.1 ABC transporter permease subunit [Sinorhizobium medicae]
MKDQGKKAQAYKSSGRARRFAALVRKESYQVVRDPSSILIAFVLPLVLLFLFGYGVSLDTTRTRVALVVEETSPLTRDLAASFEASRYFSVVAGRDRREFEDELVLGHVRGIVVIPAGFAADHAAARHPSVQVIVDGSDPNTANFVQNYAQGTVANWERQRMSEGRSMPPAISTEQRFWFNPQLTSRNFLVPGSIAIVMTLVGTLLTSLVVAREWERGTMEAMMATPVSAAELLAGKLLPYFVLGLTSMTLCVLLAVFVFDVPFRGSVAALYALSATFLMPALGQGLLISAATKNQFLASQLALISAFLPAFLLSGFLFEINSMPTVIQWITYAVPASYLIPSLQTVFLAGNIWPMFARAIAVMFLIGCMFFALAARSTRKRIG